MGKLQRNGVAGAPTRYRGSKWTLWDWMAPYMAFPHRGFVDVFGGGGNVTIAKPPVKMRVYNDIDSGAVNFFQQARDNFEELAWLLTMTPYSREEFNRCRIRTGDETPVEWARKWFCSQWMSRSATPFDRSGIRRAANPDGPRTHAQYQYANAKIAMVQVAQVFQGVMIENKDFRDIITEYQHPTTLLYCDPPYLRSTGRNVDYKHDPKGDDEYALHSDLADYLLKAVGYRIVAGSPSQEYKDWYEDRGWQRVDTKMKRDGNGGRDDSGREMYYTESMWLCPRVQEALNWNKQMSLFDLMGGTDEEE